MNNHLPCPIIGCPSNHPTANKKFSTMSQLIKHLESETHKNSRHLLDHSTCNKINLFRCTHNDCSNNKHVFFQSHKALTTHYSITHPLTCLPTAPTNTPNPYKPFTDEIFICPGNDHQINNWDSGVNYILANYNREPPHFRSSWRIYLNKNNLIRFNNIVAKIIHIIIQTSGTDHADIFWWLLFNIERLILAPTPEVMRDHQSVRSMISQRIRDLHCGNIELLFTDSTFNSNWNKKSPRPPTRNGDNAAQIAADEDNYRTAITRACAFNKIATIDESNHKTVKKLYPRQISHTKDQPLHEPTSNNQLLHLPGNVCDTIRKSGKNKGTGILSDSIDIFISLVKRDDKSINNDIQQLFNIIYQGNIPKASRPFFTDTYLFCLHKDQNDPQKLRPIGIPSAIRRIMASHIAKQWKDKFALHLLPYNYAVGIPNGMDFIIKTMQLSIEKFIDSPQQRKELPSRAAIFVDLTNMFNSVSRQELFDTIKVDFPELTQLTSLLYDNPGNVKYKWKNTIWNQLQMEEGVNQGCPLSPIFATLVLHRFLKPLDEKLRQRAADRLRNGDKGDDGFGSIAHLLAYMDDISSTVHHQDVQFFCTEIEKLGRSRGCFVNPQKTRILTSCSGESIIPTLTLTNPSLAQEIQDTISTYSIASDSTPIELTDGFRLLGSPIGSATFAQSFYDEQLKETEYEAKQLAERIPDLHTRLKLFSQCTINKLPHLLDSDVMHNHTPDFDNSLWYNWNGHLTHGIDNIIRSFFHRLLDIPSSEEMPTYSTLNSHLNINKGGLGIINPSTRTVPNFVINMMTCRRRINQGFQVNKDITPVNLHTSIANLYDISSNHNSACLSRYFDLLPHISSICNGPKDQPTNSTIHFESSISTKSARDRIKKFCGNLVTSQIHATMEIEAPEHTHLLPSILSPQTSYPLIGMNRNNPEHRLPNWTFTIAIKRKLRLPLYHHNSQPSCKCKRDVDLFGDHWFSCIHCNKKMAHNIIRDSWATALQPALATAGYINHTTNLDKERSNLPITETSARPFDISFDPDTTTSGTTHTPSPYTTIGFDITITNCCKPKSTNDSPKDALSRSAFADLHLQEAERKKLMRRDRKPDIDYPHGVSGEQTIGELLAANMLMIPFTLDPHGKWGPLTENFLNQTTHDLHYSFRANKPNAAAMLSKITRHPCPIGILKTADAIWKSNPTRPFFGHSYTSPTPSLYTIQQLGLGITKAYASHIKNALKTIHAPAPECFEHEANSSISIGVI